MAKSRLKKIHVQAGVPDNLGRNIPGLFTLLVDPFELREQMERAYRANGRRSKCGALTVEFQATSNPYQADFIAKEFTPDSLEIRGDPRGKEFCSGAKESAA